MKSVLLKLGISHYLFWALAFTPLLFCSCRPGSSIDLPSGRGAGPAIRILLLAEVDGPVAVAVEGPVAVSTLPDGAVAWKGSQPRLAVQAEGAGLSVAGLSVAGRSVTGRSFAGPVRLTPLESRRFSLSRQQGEGAYRGVLDVFNHGGKLRLINQLPLEEYLAGVVGKEMSGSRFPLEALKAQAVAARTFTLYRLRAAMQGAASLPLESAFPATSEFQSYGGAACETVPVLQAVRETAGQVLTWEGKLFQAYYHASCGGSTASGALFNEKDIPPLHGVPCARCQASPERRWELKIPLAELERALAPWARERGVKLGKIQEVQPVENGARGRSRYLRVVHAAGRFEIRLDRFRQLLNAEAPNRLRSCAFTASILPEPALAMFQGSGFGHGVGLCQSGAAAMAAGDRRSFGELLTHYYPECGILKVY
ncbi:MAG: SpoIID/LytB domain-containing protein [Planctomycetes bacterium]|nr:SpoIID/LytB domain-containing protein [Planctomycetota bacterium]